MSYILAKLAITYLLVTAARWFPACHSGRLAWSRPWDWRVQSENREWNPRGILASDSLVLLDSFSFPESPGVSHWSPVASQQMLLRLCACATGVATLSPRPSHAWLHLLGIRALRTARRRTIFFPRNIPPRESRVGGKLDPRSLQSPKLREFPSWLSYFLLIF